MVVLWSSQRTSWSILLSHLAPATNSLSSCRNAAKQRLAEMSLDYVRVERKGRCWLGLSPPVTRYPNLRRRAQHSPLPAVASSHELRTGERLPSFTPLASQSLGMGCYRQQTAEHMCWTELWDCEKSARGNNSRLLKNIHVDAAPEIAGSQSDRIFPSKAQAPD